jgi:hypothetical protein
MGRALDLLAMGLLLAASLALTLGVRALDREEDPNALYWLAAGALMLKGATDLLRPRRTR